MRRHVLAVHQGVRFPCNLCNYRAPDKGSLLRHTRGVHQGIRYYCDFCFYSATQKGNLKKHQGMKHKDNNYSCMYCTLQVNWKGSFIKHLQNQHGDLWQHRAWAPQEKPIIYFHLMLTSPHRRRRMKRDCSNLEIQLKVTLQSKARICRPQTKSWRALKLWSMPRLIHRNYCSSKQKKSVWWRRRRRMLGNLGKTGQHWIVAFSVLFAITQLTAQPAWRGTTALFTKVAA